MSPSVIIQMEMFSTSIIAAYLHFSGHSSSGPEPSLTANYLWFLDETANVVQLFDMEFYRLVQVYKGRRAVCEGT